MKCQRVEWLWKIGVRANAIGWDLNNAMLSRFLLIDHNRVISG